MNQRGEHSKLILTAGWLAIVGALLAAVGDALLLHDPAGDYLEGDYAFMEHIGRTRLLWGHFLGVLCIPLEAAGLYLVYQGLVPVGKRWALGAAALGTYVIFPGVAYHGTLFAFAYAVRDDSGQVEAFRAFSEPLAAIFVSGFFVLMLVLAALIFLQKTRFPRWLVLCTPLVSYPVWVGFYMVWPPIGNYLVPMGFNLSMAVLFIGILASGALREEN